MSDQLSDQEKDALKNNPAIKKTLQERQGQQANERKHQEFLKREAQKGKIGGPNDTPGR